MIHLSMWQWQAPAERFSGIYFGADSVKKKGIGRSSSRSRRGAQMEATFSITPSSPGGMMPVRQIADGTGLRRVELVRSQSILSSLHCGRPPAASILAGKPDGQSQRQTE